MAFLQGKLPFGTSYFGFGFGSMGSTRIPLYRERRIYQIRTNAPKAKVEASEVLLTLRDEILVVLTFLLRRRMKTNEDFRHFHKATLAHCE